MKLLDQTEVKLEWDDLNKLTYHQRQEAVRSGGLHVSDILKHLAIKWKMYDSDDAHDEMPLRIILGFAWEEYCARLYPNLWWQPGEFIISDGMGPDIACSPDGIEHDDEQGGWLVHEFKYSGKSLKDRADPKGGYKDIRKEWLWIQQGQAYVNALRQRGLESNSCCYHICWKYGDYKFPLTERYFRYVVEFEESELEGNLSMICQHREEVMNGLNDRMPKM